MSFASDRRSHSRIGAKEQQIRTQDASSTLGEPLSFGRAFASRLFDPNGLLDFFMWEW